MSILLERSGGSQASPPARVHGSGHRGDWKCDGGTVPTTDCLISVFLFVHMYVCMYVCRKTCTYNMSLQVMH